MIIYHLFSLFYENQNSELFLTVSTNTLKALNECLLNEQMNEQTNKGMCEQINEKANQSWNKAKGNRNESKLQTCRAKPESQLYKLWQVIVSICQALF